MFVYNIYIANRASSQRLSDSVTHVAPPSAMELEEQQILHRRLAWEKETIIDVRILSLSTSISFSSATLY